MTTLDEAPGRRPLLVSKAWVQAVVIVVLIGFFVLGLLAYRTYQAEPPIPNQVVGPAGEVVFTGADVRAGQQIFLRNGLMEYGSIFGHGAYLGPDFTADYLHRAALSVRQSYGGPGSDRARSATIADFQQNRYDGSTRTLRYSAGEAAAFTQLLGHYTRLFRSGKTGLRPDAITVGRFHRGIALALMILAGLILAIALAVYHRPLELVVLGAGAVVVAARLRAAAW